MINLRTTILFIYKKGNNFFSKHNAGRFYPFKLLNNFLVSHLRSNFTLVKGHKMFLDSEDSLGLSINKSFEPVETRIIMKEIKKGDTVLDIGANIGYYTLIFAKLVGTKGKVIAFEPDPVNFSILKKNIELNGYRNVILIKKAVSDKNEKLKLYLSEKNKGDHRIYNSYDNRKYVEIESIRLDDYFKNFRGDINFIKMDIQGAEGVALKGMNKLLKKYKNLTIVSEYWPNGLKKSKINPKKYLSTLLSNDFKLYLINEQKWWIEQRTTKQKQDLRPISIDDLINIFKPENDKTANLLCKKI